MTELTVIESPEPEPTDAELDDWLDMRRVVALYLTFGDEDYSLEDAFGEAAVDYCHEHGVEWLASHGWIYDEDTGELNEECDCEVCTAAREADETAQAKH